PGAVPRVPTPPRGEQIASYATYLEAQKAVDFLSDNKFAVELVTIVGTDLKMVERVTGRLTYGRVALAGAASGAWFGLFVGILLYLFSGQGGFVLTAIAIGAGFGLLFSVLSYALTRGRRDFTSQSQIVASAYGILCAPERSGEARQLLARMPDGAAGARADRGAARAAPPALDAARGRAALRGDAADARPAGRRAARPRRAPRSRGAAPRAARAPGLTPTTAQGRPADLVVRGPAL